MEEFVRIASHPLIQGRIGIDGSEEIRAPFTIAVANDLVKIRQGCRKKLDGNSLSIVSSLDCSFAIIEKISVQSLLVYI